MADDEAIALYGAVKKMAQAMAEREAALHEKTAALDAAIANLQSSRRCWASRPVSTSRLASKRRARTTSAVRSPMLSKGRSRS